MVRVHRQEVVKNWGPNYNLLQTDPWGMMRPRSNHRTPEAGGLLLFLRCLYL